MEQILKYPRTQHIKGSKEQFGDEDMNVVPLSALKDCFLVVEEKMDGANSGISFDEDGELMLQSRGHYLTGGPRERHFALLKTWGGIFRNRLWQLLGSRYIMYGEWMFAKHTVYYDKLPHYFLEFDIYDKKKEVFLSTKRRKEMIDSSSFIHSVRVLQTGICESPGKLKNLIGSSYAISGENKMNLVSEVEKQHLREERALKETDLSGVMEGLYIKEEDDEVVLNRYKYVRGDFIAAVFKAEGHWQNKPIIPNKLANEGVMYEME